MLLRAATLLLYHAVLSTALKLADSLSYRGPVHFFPLHFYFLFIVSACLTPHHCRFADRRCCDALPCAMLCCATNRRLI